VAACNAMQLQQLLQVRCTFNIKRMHACIHVTTSPSGVWGYGTSRRRLVCYVPRTAKKGVPDRDIVRAPREDGLVECRPCTYCAHRRQTHAPAALFLSQVAAKGRWRKPSACCKTHIALVEKSSKPAARSTFHWRFPLSNVSERNRWARL
jgi:hypothetical protein